jgi:hypothetical protein
MVAPVQVQFEIKRETYETDTRAEDEAVTDQNQW